MTTLKHFLCRLLGHRNDISCIDENYTYAHDQCGRCKAKLPIAYPHHAEYTARDHQNFSAPPQRKTPATIDEMFDRMNKVPRGMFYGHDPMTIWMEAWRAAEWHHNITEQPR